MTHHSSKCYELIQTQSDQHAIQMTTLLNRSAKAHTEDKVPNKHPKIYELFVAHFRERLISSAKFTITMKMSVIRRKRPNQAHAPQLKK